MSDQNPPRVTILLASHFGENHIAEQLKSIADQTHENWRLIISDDGSTDMTREIILDFATQFSPEKVQLIEGPCKGTSSDNFMSLLRSGHFPDTDYIAFCDQDDVWLPEKLTQGLAVLAPFDAQDIVLYGGRSIVTDEALNQIALSALRPKPLGFKNALMQNFAGGNTFILTPRAGQLLAKAAAKTHQVIVHDWWCYIVVTGAGGQAIHDNTPSLLYRQHQENVIGNNAGFSAQMRRMAGLLNGTYRRWNATNIDAIEANSDLLTNAAATAFQDLKLLHNSRGFGALKILKNSGLYRQSRLSHAALWVGAFLGRL